MPRRSFKWLTIFTILLTASAIFALLHGSAVHGTGPNAPAITAAFAHPR